MDMFPAGVQILDHSERGVTVRDGRSGTVYMLTKGDQVSGSITADGIHRRRQEERVGTVRIKGEEPEEQYDVGVMIARFQVPFLTEGHVAVLDFIKERHDKVIVFLGCSELPSSFRNPLDYQARRQMVQEKYPAAEIIPLLDRADDGVWSKQLDKLITSQLMPRQRAVLYGSRDSFIRHYHGRFPVLEIESTIHTSGTEIRSELTRKRSGASREWREGAIWAASACYPTSYQACDAAIFSKDGKCLVLGRKPNENGYRLPGGFVDPEDDSLENAALREALEETGLYADRDSVSYIMSKTMDDWRYSKEPHCIKTALFGMVDVESHSICPGDDLEEARWMPIKDISNKFIETQIRPNHKELVVAALGWAQGIFGVL